MIKEVVKNKNGLIIHSENGIFSLNFLTSVAESLIIEDSLILLVDTNKETYGDRNLFRISEYGKVAWQVAQPDNFRGSDANRSACFTQISLSKDGKLQAYSLNSFLYEVDFETGELNNKVYMK